MNSYALGRIVAGDAVAARFISARKSRHYGDVHCAFRRRLQSPACDRPLHASSCGELASVAGLGVSGPFGPRGGISSGMRPGNSSGRGGEPGSRTGGVISGCGLPGGIPGGGSAGVPGVDGGISGGSIGIGASSRSLSSTGQRRCRAEVPSHIASKPRVIPARGTRPRYCGRRDRARRRHSSSDDNAGGCRAGRCRVRLPR